MRVGAGTIAAEPRDERGLTASDIGEGVQVPEPEATVHAFWPYAKAWGGFDKLQKRAKGATGLGWVHWTWGLVASTIPLFVPHRIPKKDSVTFVVSVLVLGLIHLLRSDHARREFAHWRCPRCHAEWPGKKLEERATLRDLRAEAAPDGALTCVG